jgi:hypothetical protein
MTTHINRRTTIIVAMIVTLTATVAAHRSPLFAKQEIVLKAIPIVTVDETTRKPRLFERDEPRPELIIARRGSAYVWQSNNNKKLLKIEKDPAVAFGKQHDRTIFISPDGDGIIIIRHDPSNLEDPRVACDIGAQNYVEYRLSGFSLREYSGRTVPYPYPQGNLCP